MSKNIAHTSEKQEIGHTGDGAYTFTVGIIIGLLVMIAGVALTIYLGGVYSFVFGVPLVVIGLLIPIAAQLLLGGRRR